MIKASFMRWTIEEGKNINRLAIVLRLLSRNPTTTGSGLIAESLEKSFIDFRNVNQHRNKSRG